MYQSELTEYESGGPPPANCGSEVECPSCQRDDFASQAGMRRHHTMAHGECLSVASFTCDWCGVEDERRKDVLDKSDHNFCSTECYGKWESEHCVGENGRNWGGGQVKRECAACGNTKTVDPHYSEKHDRAFCDHSCYGQWLSSNQTGESHPSWDSVSVECATCGCSLERPRRYVEGAINQYCDHECYGTAISGTGSPHWRGGSSVYKAVLLNLRDESWSQTRSRVRESSDGCYMCGADPAHSLDIHHIVPVLCGGSNDDDLLMALCNSCHATVENYTRDLLDPVLAY